MVSGLLFLLNRLEQLLRALADFAFGGLLAAMVNKPLRQHPLDFSLCSRFGRVAAINAGKEVYLRPLPIVLLRATAPRRPRPAGRS